MLRCGSDFARLGRDAAKIFAFCDASGADPKNSPVQLLADKLTFEEARRSYKWSGTLIEARIGQFRRQPTRNRIS